jgi:hypothetical protein
MHCFSDETASADGTQVMGKTLRFASQINVPNICKLKFVPNTLNHFT